MQGLNARWQDDLDEVTQSGVPPICRHALDDRVERWIFAQSLRLC
jgi:hypothetical protein